MKKIQITLRSANPEEYGDLTIECPLIPNHLIGKFVSRLAEEKKFYAHKSAPVSARIGTPGEKVVTTLYVPLDEQKYIWHEETNEGE